MMMTGPYQAVMDEPYRIEQAWRQGYDTVCNHFIKHQQEEKKKQLIKNMLKYRKGTAVCPALLP